MASTGYEKSSSSAKTFSENSAYLIVLESAIVPVRRSSSAHFEMKTPKFGFFIKRR